MTVNIFIVF